MYRTKRKPSKRGSISNLLTPNEVEDLLRDLGIEWPTSKVKANGWVVISSPLRKDEHPSFGLNIKHGGFRDFATNEKGDVLKLTAKVLKIPQVDAIDYIINKFNIPYYKSN